MEHGLWGEICHMEAAFRTQVKQIFFEKVKGMCFLDNPESKQMIR